MIMRLHVPHLGSLHFVTVVAFEGVDENLASVKCSFKFFGCLRLSINFLSPMIAFIFVDDFKKLRFSFKSWGCCNCQGLKRNQYVEMNETLRI